MRGGVLPSTWSRRAALSLSLSFAHGSRDCCMHHSRRVHLRRDARRLEDPDNAGEKPATIFTARPEFTAEAGAATTAACHYDMGTLLGEFPFASKDKVLLGIR